MFGWDSILCFEQGWFECFVLIVSFCRVRIDLVVVLVLVISCFEYPRISNLWLMVSVINSLAAGLLVVWDILRSSPLRMPLVAPAG